MLFMLVMFQIKQKGCVSSYPIIWRFEKGDLYGKAHKIETFSFSCVIIEVANCPIPTASETVSQKTRFWAEFSLSYYHVYKVSPNPLYSFTSIDSSKAKDYFFHCSLSSSQAASMAESSSVQDTFVHSTLLTIKPQQNLLIDLTPFTYEPYMLQVVECLKHSPLVDALTKVDVVPCPISLISTQLPTTTKL